MGWARVAERPLRLAVFAGLGLILLTPFVITPGTIFPFVVGKALWSRSLIEAVVALWAVLALADPAYRPPRSWVLVALAAGLAVSLLAAAFGVSLQHSLWSSYERMQGLVDGAHWVAFAVVLAAVLRSAAAWRALLSASACAGTAMACLVIARHWQFEVPFYGTAPEPYLPRMGGPLGNPTFLGAYLLTNLMLALGLAARAWRRAGGLLWTAAAALQLWGLTLAGSVGAFAGLGAGLGFAALAGAVLARGRARWAGAAVLVALGASALALGLRFVEPGRAAAPGFDLPAVRYVAGVNLHRPSVQSRLAAWEAGLEGFAERPALGWGPENFATVFGRFASGYGAVAEPHDQAHGKLVEVAATTGAAGLVAWFALWALALASVWRAASRTDAGERALAVCVGAALSGHVVQSQFLFDTAAGSLQCMVLLGFAAGREAAAFGQARRPRLPAGLSRRRAALVRARRARVALGTAVAALALAGLAANHAIFTAAGVRHDYTRSGTWRSMAHGIEGFGPLANTWRGRLFGELARHWPELWAEDRPGARQLLQWAQREAREVARTEPQNWRLQHGVARLYRAAAATDPAYAAAAREALARAGALAPERAVFQGALRPPQPLESRRLEDGRRALHWRRSAGAGYHQVAASTGPGAWRAILYAYGPGRGAFIAPAAPGPGPRRYRIKACRWPGDCTAWVEWPAPAAPDGGSP